MAQFSLRGNPYLAGFLGLLVIGLGHVYLRRWLRALGWLAVGVAVSVAMTILFPPDPAATPLVDPTEIDPMALLPTIAVTSASAVDAYLLARRERASEAAGAAGAGTVEAGADDATCPYCGGDVDPELEFCHWCTREFTVAPDGQAVEADADADSNANADANQPRS